MSTTPAPAKATATSRIVGQFQKYVVPSYARTPVALVRGEGRQVWDAEGKRYLDFGGGIAVSSLGHGHPGLVRAIARQAKKLIHVSNLYHTEPQAKLAQRLVKLMGGKGKVFFCNSGAEANEGLYKLARLAANAGAKEGQPRKFEIITAFNSFHGRTLAGIAATGQEKVKKGFDPAVPGFVHVPYNDLAAVEAAITSHTAAVLIEGVQGEIGIIPALAEYLLGLRDLCNRKGILLLMDAVQCGMFRTGTFMSYGRILEGHPRAEEFQPDAVSMAKSLGGGFPIGCIWIAKKHQDLFQPGTHGTTYGGTPLACAAALAVLTAVEKENLCENIRNNGDYLIEGLRKLAGRTPVKDVRGFGFLVGVELNTEARDFIAYFREKGLLVIPSGTHAFRLLPPYNTTRAEIDEALAIIESVLTAPVV